MKSKIDEVKRRKIFINGYEYWLDLADPFLYDTEIAKHGIPVDILGSGEHIQARCCGMTDNENKQLTNVIRRILNEKQD